MWDSWSEPTWEDVILEAQEELDWGDVTIEEETEIEEHYNPNLKTRQEEN